ncbi:MAG: hypothetical protein IKE43_04285 [Coriobacteriales bacterium]|nr:hypothetical protein [Coriobacteriales bacterium]
MAKSKHTGAGIVDETARIEYNPSDTEAVPKAPEGYRYVGFCRKCHDFEEMTTTFTCLEGGHPKQDIAVALLLEKDEPKPHIPRLNIGALFMPALWGPAHGQWYMILFYPLWLLLDRLIYGSIYESSGLIALAVIAGVGTAVFTIAYALYANTYAYVRVATQKTPEEYNASERKQAIIWILLAIAFIFFATWYNLFVRVPAAV